MSQASPSARPRLQELPCLILVGGLGTRLRPAVGDLPKPMAGIAGKPFLEYLVRWLRQAAITEVTLCTGFGAEKIQQYFQDGAGLGVRIRYSLERQPLGTWGAIRLAAEQLSGRYFLVLNGDSWLPVQLARLLEFHLRKRGVASIAAAELGRGASRFGSIELDSQGRVVRFAEKQNGDSGLINGGVYIFSQEALALAPPAAFSVEREVFPALISHGLYALPVPGYFVDIGVPEEYKRLQNEAENWMQELALPKVGASKC